MFRTLVAASGLLLGGVAAAQSVDTPPTPVRGLEVTVYSPTAAGLRWRRASDDRGVRGYEVYQEGELVGEFDALSYIATGLAPGSLNNFTVITIDSAGQRSNASTGIAFETPGGQAPVARPMTPTVRSAVYSQTAAGIAWTRPSDTGTAAMRVAQYEVRRDGVLVFTTRDTSYIDTPREAGRTYAYEVVAINPLGGRSTPGTTTVATPGRAAGGGGGGGDPAVAAPAGLRSVLYSMSAGAIAWERAATPGFRYEVFRDGTSLGITDGTSYVDSTLSGGQSYAYEVVAIDRQGRRSAASAVTLDTGGNNGPAAPPVDPSPSDPMALDTVSDELITALAGYRADAKVDDVRALVETVVDGALGSRDVPDTSTTFPDGLPTRTVETDVATANTEYDCAFGGQLVSGTADLEIRESGYSRTGVAESFRFEDCRTTDADGRDVVVNGGLSTLDDVDSGSRFSTRRLTYAWSDFSTATGETTVLEIDGSTTYSSENVQNFPATTRDVRLGRYVERDESGDLVERLDDVTFGLRLGEEGPGPVYVDYALALSGTLTSPATGNVGVAVDTVTDLSRRARVDLQDDPNATPFTGELGLRAEDGRTLSVTARDTRTEELFVDLVYTDADGEVRESENVPFVELSTAGPDGAPPSPE